MPASRKNRVKLQDIAQASGVSLTAVSLALSDKAGISQETRKRVLEMARSLGYFAKSPVTPESGRPLKTIGLLVKSDDRVEPHANQFYSHIITGIEAACRQMGLNLMFANLPVNDDNYPVDIPPLLEKVDVDGLILAGVYIDAVVGRILSDRGCPVVLIDSYSQGFLYNSVLTDNCSGAYQAVEYLIRSGHRHIGFVGGGAQAYPSFRDRRAGYQQAMADHSIRELYFADCPVRRETVGEAALALLRDHPQITALMAVNDEAAITAMYALIEAGIPVPQRVSMMGFDDIYLAGSVVPSLTTMHVTKRNMGKLAVQLLHNQVSQSEAGCVTSVFRPTLVERNSVSRIEMR
jgi:DNA-binding LacI/PurR family transcriptional regulator